MENFSPNNHEFKENEETKLSLEDIRNQVFERLENGENIPVKEILMYFFGHMLPLQTNTDQYYFDRIINPLTVSIRKEEKLDNIVLFMHENESPENGLKSALKKIMKDHKVKTVREQETVIENGEKKIKYQVVYETKEVFLNDARSQVPLFIGQKNRYISPVNMEFSDRGSSLISTSGFGMIDSFLFMFKRNKAEAFVQRISEQRGNCLDYSVYKVLASVLDEAKTKDVSEIHPFVFREIQESSRTHYAIAFLRNGELYIGSGNELPMKTMDFLKEFSEKKQKTGENLKRSEELREFLAHYFLLARNAQKLEGKSKLFEDKLSEFMLILKQVKEELKSKK